MWARATLAYHDLTLNERSFQITFTRLALGMTDWLVGSGAASSYVVSVRQRPECIQPALTLGTVGVSSSVLSYRNPLPNRSWSALGTQAVAAGELDSHLSMERSDEIGELADALM